MLKSHNAGELRAKDAGKRVTLAGWVRRRREHGGLIFIDLRDRWGVTQVVADISHSPESHQTANRLRHEFVIQVTGTVQKRLPQAVNPDMATGEIEVVADEIR